MTRTAGVTRTAGMTRVVCVTKDAGVTGTARDSSARSSGCVPAADSESIGFGGHSMDERGHCRAKVAVARDAVQCRPVHDDHRDWVELGAARRVPQDGSVACRAELIIGWVSGRRFVLLRMAPSCRRSGSRSSRAGWRSAPRGTHGWRSSGRPLTLCIWPGPGSWLGRRKPIRPTTVGVVAIGLVCPAFGTRCHTGDRPGSSESLPAAWPRHRP
ncbi:hypothetical protein BJ964_007834 [Actinoplanes lobatus]|uniref:Uncharacterized protein n=1 Tax=Actinoplanes lobatus TaxID=113568 RepID=A0A7W7HN96_9ACTN|nr:hypothetical protein [Actinoplanes lobatus]